MNAGDEHRNSQRGAGEHTGQGEPFSCTLLEAVSVCGSCTPRVTHKRLFMQMLPQWRDALKDHGEVLYKDTRLVSGRYQRMRALPMDIAVQRVRGWLPAAVEAIRTEVGMSTTCLAGYDQAVQLVAAGVQLDIADDDAEQDV
jgi:hypothetical protein